MQYPHRRFLVFLLSKKLTHLEISEECTARQLTCPDDQDIQQLVEELGDVPAGWRSELSRAAPSFRRWLRDNDVLDLWAGSAVSQQADDLCFHISMRRDIEALILLDNDSAGCLKKLKAKYKSHAPDLKALESFIKTFWDMSKMSRKDVQEFVSAMSASQDREELLPALYTDRPQVYGHLGIQHSVSSEELYDSIIALAHQQINAARRSPKLNGSAIMGLAALSRQGMDAVRARDELGIMDGTADDLRDQAAAFRMRLMESEDIPSIDDLEGTVIEAQYVEMDNVRRFPSDQ